MSHISNCCILFFYCLCSLSFYPAGAWAAAALFISVTAASLLYLFPAAPCRIGAALLFAALLLLRLEFGLYLAPVFYFLCPSKEQMRRFLPGFLLSALFTGAALLYRTVPDGLWQPFLFIVCGCAFALILRLRTDSREALYARYLHTMDSDTEYSLLLKEKNQSLLEKQDYEIYTATLQERNRIAREIHDNVGHMLSRSILMVGALKTVNKDAALQETLSLLDGTLNEAMDSIRESVHDLHDRSLNLKESLQTLAQDFPFCPVSLQYDISPDAPAQVKYCFIAVVKEALVNISRHSQANAAWIRAQEHPAFYQLTVRDNGAGAAPADTTSGGIGLANMRNRVDALHGTIQFFTEDGFCIFITIPRQSQTAQPEACHTGGRLQ